MDTTTKEITFQYLVIDLPSPCEIERRIPTEGDLIESIVSNQGRGRRFKAVRSASVNSMEKALLQVRDLDLAKIRFVHLSAHGDDYGLAAIRGGISWTRFGRMLAEALPPLREGERRVLCISACGSRAAADKLGPILAGRFSAIYCLVDDEVTFATAATVWAMFYFAKKPKNPHARIVSEVNRFAGREVLEFRNIETCIGRRRRSRRPIRD